MNKVPVNGHTHPYTSRRLSADVLISGGGIRFSENCRHHNPNGVMLISSSANYRKKNEEGMGVILGSIRSLLMIDLLM